MLQGRAWLGWILVPVALFAAAIPGMWVLMSVTAPVLHPKPQTIPSVTGAAPPPQWASAVEQARLIVRASLSEENLPAVSVAVGIAETFFGRKDSGLRISSPACPSHRVTDFGLEPPPPCSPRQRPACCWKQTA
jgi:hypothetical protein